jgi:hypothetical protein
MQERAPKHVAEDKRPRGVVRPAEVFGVNIEPPPAPEPAPVVIVEAAAAPVEVVEDEPPVSRRPPKKR